MDYNAIKTELSTFIWFTIKRYRSDPKFSDIQVRVNSVDPDQANSFEPD